MSSSQDRIGTRVRRNLCLIIMSATLTCVGTWLYHLNNRPSPQVVTFLFDDFDCRTFTIFEDPSLGEFNQNLAVRIPSDGPQAVRLPQNQGRYSFWDINGSGAYKTELEIGTFGPKGTRVGYSFLGIGAELPCGREELRDELVPDMQSLFEAALVVQPPEG